MRVLRKRVAEAISRIEYEDKRKNQHEGSPELSRWFPAIAADAAGTAPVNERDVEELIGRVEAASKA